jgi:hypothetical protein
MSRKFITIEKNFDFSKINMDLSKELNLSGSMIIKDMVDKNRKGLSYNGEKLEPLNPKTIKRKRAKGRSNPSRALYDSGLMIGRGSAKKTGGRGLFLSKRASKTKQEAVISFAKDRHQIGIYHNEGTNKLPKREWFGVSDKVEKDILRMIELRIDRILRSA